MSSDEFNRCANYQSNLPFLHHIRSAQKIATEKPEISVSAGNYTLARPDLSA